jgi:hypothetical protein
VDTIDRFLDLNGHLLFEVVSISEGGVNEVQVADGNSIKAFPRSAKMGAHESSTTLKDRHNGLFE